MSVAQRILQNLPPALHKNGVVRVASRPLDRGPLDLAKGRGVEPSLAASEWQAKLSLGEIPPGVVELASEGGVALGTSLALRSCLRVQREAQASFGVIPWCAFIDPTASLYAPGVHAAGVDLSRLLVIRPDEESITRVTLRLVESKVFPLVIVDLMGLPGEHLELSLSPWVRIVRRLSLALSGTNHSVLLLTDKNAKRALPLPVSERLVLSRRSVRDVQVTVSKSLSGNLGHTKLRWTRRSPETKPLAPPGRTFPEVPAHVG